MKRLRVFSLLVLAVSGGVFLVAKSYSAYQKNSLTKIASASVTPAVSISKDKSPAADAVQPAAGPAPQFPTEKSDADDQTTADNLAAPQKTSSAKYPAQILDLADWKETMPEGSSGKPKEITADALASFVDKDCFHINATADGVVFRAPVNGVTTSGSKYPRSELREMTSNGNTQASWSTASGTHTMFIDEAITAVPKNKSQVVAGQIHDANDDVIVIRLDYPNLHVDINGKTGPTLDAHYSLGKRFTVKFVASGGAINIFYNGNTSPAYTLKKSDSGCFFKAGAYTQSNCTKEKDCSGGNYGEVVIYKLDVQHA